jgi:flagellar hook protein FlgE
MDPNGNYVLGWNRIGTALSTNGPIVPIKLDMGTTSPPIATTTMTTTTNLDANAAVGAASDYVVPIQVYDSLGQSHTVQVAYQKTAANTWSYAISTDDPAATVTNGGGTMQFSATGQLITPPTAVTPTITGWGDGAATMSPTWNLTGAGTGLITQFAADSATSNSTQDGFASGNIRSLVVDQNGMITGNFTNGQTVPLAQVAIATFSNMNGLSKIGDNNWSETLASGAPNVGPANQGGRGTILGSQLELSNVDVADEFTKLIIAQRGYQANSKIVTTSDQLLQETLNLKQ